MAQCQATSLCGQFATAINDSSIAERGIALFLPIMKPALFAHINCYLKETDLGMKNIMQSFLKGPYENNLGSTSTHRHKHVRHKHHCMSVITFIHYFGKEKPRMFWIISSFHCTKW